MSMYGDIIPKGDNLGAYHNVYAYNTNAAKAKILTRKTMAIIDSRYFRMRQLLRNESSHRAIECIETQFVT